MEGLQVHGAEAVRRFKITTQKPIENVFYTSGPNYSDSEIKLVHTSNESLLQCPGTVVGLALSAAWYCGKERFDRGIAKLIHAQLSAMDYEDLMACDMPGWMRHNLLHAKTQFDNWDGPCSLTEEEKVDYLRLSIQQSREDYLNGNTHDGEEVFRKLKSGEAAKESEQRDRERDQFLNQKARDDYDKFVAAI